MYTFSKRSNLLERSAEHFELQEVKEPNMYRELFTYDEIPKVAFNHRIVPINMPDEIWITDTTFRDGQQSREPYSAEHIKRIYRYLHELSGPNGIIRQSEFFLYTQKDRKAVYDCLGMGFEFPEITSWIRASKKDFELVRSIGLKETGILVSCSDHHIFLQMHMNRRQAI
ncbi:MAG: 2-isopropylmalate synthase, partial [Defluviitaleaceae bacterium]|nr:2-isopropylmalate synthase [Defluviitaleaceae bacterium]